MTRIFIRVREEVHCSQLCWSLTQYQDNGWKASMRLGEEDILDASSTDFWMSKMKNTIIENGVIQQNEIQKSKRQSESQLKF